MRETTLCCSPSPHPNPIPPLLPLLQYTWDKQVETWVKKSGILGGAGKDPTVISPKQYSRRFRCACVGGSITGVVQVCGVASLLELVWVMGVGVPARPWAAPSAASHVYPDLAN